MKELTSTQIKIHECARKHFLDNGFKSASLRKIVSDAGFTLGAFYGYYDSKEELFCALVDDTAKGIWEILNAIIQDMNSFPENERVYHMTECYLNKLPQLVDYLLDHLDDVKLIVNCSEGTRYEGFVKQIQTIDESNSEVFIRASNVEKYPLNPATFQILMNAYFSMLTETILSGMARDEIISVMTDIQMVYQYGIMGLMTQSQTNMED